MRVDYPCWLSKDELAIASKLIDLGYYYAGNFEADDEDEFGETFSFPVIGKVGRWSVFSSCGELGLVVEIRGASYVLITENPSEFKPLLNKTLRIIREETKKQKQQAEKGIKQLCLI